MRHVTNLVCAFKSRKVAGNFRLLPLLVLCMTAFNHTASSQDDNAGSWVLRGTVADEKNDPLAGVSIKILGTTRGGSTGPDGTFLVEMTNETDSVSFSYIGYKTRVERPGAARKIEVVLERAQSADLSDVVVVGFGKQKKVSVTAAISSISTREISRVATPSLSNSIAGKLPGIITRQASGEPGYDAAQVYIRGLATFGNNNPLILIDGVERDMNQINAQEIESFTILKDASATAVYGVRGANGVILINTKRGKTGKPAVTFRTESATLQALRLPDYINAQEYAILMNEALRNNNQPARWTEEEIQKYGDGSDPYLYPNSDWTDAVLKTNTWQTINNLSVTGGNEIFKYYTNVGFTLQDGLYKQDPANEYSTNATVKRYNFRSNVDINVSKSLSLQLGLGGIIQNGNYPGFSAPDIFAAMKIVAPIAYPIRNPDGTPGGAATFVGWNPWARATQSGYTTQDRSTLQGTFSGRWDLSTLLTKGLSVRGLFSYDRNSDVNNIRNKAFVVKRYLGKDPATGEDLYSLPYREEQPLAYGIQSFSGRAIYLETQINYEREFGDHTVTAMGLYNQRDAVDLTAGTSLGNLPRRRQGLAGRLTYAYNNRYLAEANFGYNGSENFPKGKRFGFFPAFSAGWVISNEAFFKVPVVSNLKLRGSHGLVGNDQIGGARFLYLTTTQLQGQPYRFGADQQIFYGMEENQIGNPDVTWERARKTNIGLDLGLFNDRITLQVDMFNEHRRGILLQQNIVPGITGFYPWSIPWGNFGVVKNKGIDALLEIRNTTRGGFFYSLRGNFTFARNKIIENTDPNPPFPYLQTEGLRLNQPFGFITDGLFIDDKDIAESPRHTFAVPRPGDIKYKDINADGIIDSYDRLPIGHPRLPEITFGFGGTMSYKDFDFSVYFTGAANTSMYIGGTSMFAFYDGLGVNNVMREYYDNRWTPETPNAKYPAIDVSNNPNNYTLSNWWMRNGNYLRLRNAEIGYSMPHALLSKARISALRFFVNATNIITWDHIKFQDPESNDGTGGYPLQRAINIGAQIDL
jgi:TonB-linked SusC/RagA family outer membrane protein